MLITILYKKNVIKKIIKKLLKQLKRFSDKVINQVYIIRVSDNIDSSSIAQIEL